MVSDPTHTRICPSSTPAESTSRPSANAAASLLALITKPASEGAAAVYASSAPQWNGNRASSKAMPMPTNTTPASVSGLLATCAAVGNVSAPVPRITSPRPNRSPASEIAPSTRYLKAASSARSPAPRATSVTALKASVSRPTTACSRAVAPLDSASTPKAKCPSRPPTTAAQATTATAASVAATASLVRQTAALCCRHHEWVMHAISDRRATRVRLTLSALHFVDS